MTPQQLAKSDSEHAHQRAFFAYVSVARLHGFNVADEWASGIQLDIAKDRYSRTDSGITDLTWLHAVPNGGSRGDTDKSRMIQGGKMKAEGVLSGVADVVLPIPRLATATLQTMFGSATPFHGVLCGLYIEMKKPAERPKRESSKGGLSDEQIEFAEFVKSRGYAWRVCYDWIEAVDTVKTYTRG